MKRPAEFDARVMAHMPLLKRLAARFFHPNDREDAVQETVIDALEKWTNFRADGSFHRWLRFLMMEVSQRRKRRAIMTVDDPDQMLSATVPARQEDITFANQTCRHLSKTREGRMLMRIGTGELLREVGKRRGVTANRVQQLVERARASLPAAA